MTVPFMPFYIADYMADTSHLTTVEHGAYLLLIMNYWQRGQPLPNDDRKLARIAGIGPREWKRMRDTISEFFEISCSEWLHTRVESELAILRSKSLKKRNGGLARAKQMHSKCLADAQLLTDTDTETDIVGDKSPTEQRADYAFTGRTIRLRQSDFDTWLETFHAIPDLRAELVALDSWFEGPGSAKRSSWFHTAAGALSRKHQESIKAKVANDGPRKVDPFWGEVG